MCGFIREGAAGVTERLTEPDAVLLETLTVALASYFLGETLRYVFTSEKSLLRLNTLLSLLSFYFAFKNVCAVLYIFPSF